MNTVIVISGAIACLLEELVLATLIFVAMKFLAVLTSVFSQGKFIKAEAQDVYMGLSSLRRCCSGERV